MSATAVSSLVKYVDPDPDQELVPSKGTSIFPVVTVSIPRELYIRRGYLISRDLLEICCLFQWLFSRTCGLIGPLQVWS